MARGDGPRQAESKWGFFPKALEGIGRMLGSRKEPEPEVEVDSGKFLVLDRLNNTDKKDLLAAYDSLREQDAKDDRADLSANIIALLADEISKGEITVEDIKELAPLLVSEIQSRSTSKKKGAKTNNQVEIDRREEKIRLESLVIRVRRTIEQLYYQKRRFNELTQKDRTRLEPEFLNAQSVNIAEKIRYAPSLFDRGLTSYAESLRGDLAEKEKNFFAKRRVVLSPEIVKKVFELHPNDYEQSAERYEEVFARAGLLEVAGMMEEAGIVKDLNVSFSPIDGTMLRNPDERLAYIEALQKPGPLREKWRKEKPPYYEKEWSSNFVSTQVIPELLAQRVSFEESAKQIHWFQITGSSEQKDCCRAFQRNIAGAYRKEDVSAGDYPAPPAKFVEDMMTKLARQVGLFSAQIEAMRGSESPKSFEEKVHQFACHVLHQFTAVHPMVDGNGRTGRSLREYIIAKHLGSEKISEYNGIKSGFGANYSLLEHLRFSQPAITRNQMDTYYGSDLATKYQATRLVDEGSSVGIWHEPLMAHLEETDIQKEVFGNEKIVRFAARAMAIIGKK